MKKLALRVINRNYTHTHTMKSTHFDEKKPAFIVIRRHCVTVATVSRVFSLARVRAAILLGFRELPPSSPYACVNGPVYCGPDEPVGNASSVPPSQNKITKKMIRDVLAPAEMKFR